MEYHKIVNKLIGRITPAGDSSRDDAYFDNLKDMCSLVENLIMDLNDMAWRIKESKEYSVKRAHDYVEKFLDSIRNVD